MSTHIDIKLVTVPIAYSNTASNVLVHVHGLDQIHEPLVDSLFTNCPPVDIPWNNQMLFAGKRGPCRVACEQPKASFIADIQQELHH